MSLTKIPSSGLGSNLTLTGTTYISGNILPTSNNTINIGSPDARFGTLYISANTIDIGGAQISTTETGDISFTTTTGSLELSANVIEFLSNISSTVSSGYTGSAGAAGATGATGSIGFTGSVGAGYTGSQGTAGYTGSQGDTGLGFTIAKSYVSVAALQADTAPTGIVPGQFAIIDNGNTNNEENSRLYIWTGSAYTYVSDLSGAQGITGPAGTAGFTGSAGSAGASGAAGYTGSAGSTGAAGATGASGTAGYTGSASTVAGFTGSIGSSGFTGSTGFVAYAAGTAVPYILTKRNSSQQSVGSGSTVLVNLNTVVTGSAELSNGTDGFTAPRSGVYMVDVGYITNNSTHVDITEIQAIVYVNGVAQKTFYENIPAFGFNKSINGTAPVYLNTGDVVKIYFYVYNDTLIIAANSCIVTVTEMMPPSAGYNGSQGVTGYTGSAAVAVVGSNAFYNTRTYTGNGTQTTFTVTSGATVDTVIVTENGVVQTPAVDYTVAGTTLTFAAAPENAVAIQIRELSTGGITGGNSDRVFVVNDLTVTANYAIPSGKGASTVGPVTINDNVIVSVPTGSRWVIL